MKRAITVAAAVLLSVTACTPQAAPAATAGAAVEPEATIRAEPVPWSPTPTPNAACVPLSPAMLQALAAGAKNPEKFLPVSGVAVRSSTYHRDTVYVVYAAFNLKPDATRPVGGQWLTTGLEPESSTIYNMGSSLHTNFPSSATDWPELRTNDESWRVAFDCVGL